MFDLITSIVKQTGYAGIFVLMLAENVFPPFPSEMIMPLAGFTAARGELSIVGVAIAGSAGSLTGAMLWYYVGHRIGLERLKRWTQRHGRWMALSVDELERATAWFRRHCGKAVLLGRLLPTVRTLISVPAGVSGMALGRFALYSAIGSALWTSALAAAGYLLESGYERIADYLNPVSNIVFAAIALTYLYRVATFKQRNRRQVRAAR